MKAKVQVIFYSTFGHTWKIAEAIAEGATAAGASAEVLQVAETLPDEVLEKMGATEAKKAFAHVPVADTKKLAGADAIVLGSPTRYGLVATQMQAFLDNTGGLWQKGALVGKVGSGFTSTGSQHGGQETTLLGLSTFFFHMGMVVAGVPFSVPELSEIGEVSGGTPYGSSTVAGPKGDRSPTANELAIARAQGKHVAAIAAKLAAAK